MKFLLSDGSTTTDIIRYVSDSILINFNLEKGDLPYNPTRGFTKLIDTLSESDVDDQLKSNLKNSFEQSVASLKSLATISFINYQRIDTIASFTISINKTSINYEIEAGNKIRIQANS